MNVLMFASILAIRASGLTVSMILGGMDVSQNAVGAVPALLCALLSDPGAVVGRSDPGGPPGPRPWASINATLVSVFKIAAIITTLGTMQIFRGARGSSRTRP